MKKAMIWKLLERFGVQGVQFVLQLFLARLLTPEHYGVLAIMMIFVSLANVFIQTGFSTSLIQNRDVTEEDYSSVLWMTLSISSVLYVVIFFASPVIAWFYEMPELIVPLRVLAVMLFPGALNSVQLAKVSREMDFKQVFYSNIGAIAVSGIAGIVIALMGGGLWALVAQSMINVAVACIVMQFTSKLRIRFVLNWKRICVLFSFGWKLLVSGLIDTLYQDLQGLVIGKKYDSATLGFFNRGKQFPSLIMNSVNGAVQSVMLPAMSERQTKAEELKDLMRRSMALCSYVVFPMMTGLAAIATPLVKLLLTDTWLPCVPYLQIFCFSFAFFPVHSCNLQAINAIGRSDVFLKLEIIKKSYGLLAIVFAVVFFDSPLSIAATALITTLISFFVNAFPNQKLIGYSYWEQLKDIIPSLIASLLMAGGVYLIGLLPLPNLLLILLQVFLGIALYLLISVVMHLKPFEMLKHLVYQHIRTNS